jgi:hypothetical protein
MLSSLLAAGSFERADFQSGAHRAPLQEASLVGSGTAQQARFSAQITPKTAIFFTSDSLFGHQNGHKCFVINNLLAFNR